MNVPSDIGPTGFERATTYGLCKRSCGNTWAAKAITTVQLLPDHSFQGTGGS
jgi:hypothetical protein